MNGINYEDLYYILRNLCGGLIKNNKLLGIAYELGDCPVTYCGSCVKYYDGNSNEISEEVYNYCQSAYTEHNVLYYDYKGNKIDKKEYQRQIRSYQEESTVHEWFIVSELGAQFLKKFTHEYVIFLDKLDIYLWGVQFFGVNWNQVELLDSTIPKGIIELMKNEKLNIDMFNKLSKIKL